MLTIWIIHRDAQHRAALARIAGAGDNAVLGGPLDRLFESASTPSVVVLGLGDDFEPELEFVHRFGPRLQNCPWVLLPVKGDVAEAERLFDTLPARFLTYPPKAVDLRRALRDALRRRTSDRLSIRQEREALRNRFARWFADVELPELMRAIDPRMAEVPVLIRGEVGTGRGVLARYVHTFGGGPDEGFIHVSCRGVLRAEELLGQIESGAAHCERSALTIWLEDVDALPFAVQRRLQDWIEYRPPDGSLRTRRFRWIAGAGDEAELDIDPGLEPRLAETLAGITLSITALRNRPEAVDAFVAETAGAWATERRERPRQWSSDTLMLLRAYPWPGNLHELEATVIRTLSFTGADPVLPVHLRFPGDSGWLDRYGEPAPETGPSEAQVTERDLPEAIILPDDDELKVVLGTLEEMGDEPAGSDESLIVPEAEAERPRPAPRTESTQATRGSDPEPPTRSIERSLDDGPSALDMAEEAMESLLPPASDTPGSKAAPSDADESNLRQLVRALVHDVRNPLVSIRTFSELLPDHYDDDEFRTHFSELVSHDVIRIDNAISRLQDMVDLSDIKSEPVDVAQLLESLLDEHRDDIQARRLLVLKELDHSVPQALGDPLLLRDAFSGLIRRALKDVSDRGDVYIASRHHVGAKQGSPTLRVLIRYGIGTGSSHQGTRGTQLDSVMAQSIVQSLGGTFTEDTTDADECVIVIDLPAPT